MTLGDAAARGAVSRAGRSPVAARSPRVFAFMAFWMERFFRRHMNGLRIARRGDPRGLSLEGPLVVYTNHPAWWDVAACLLLGRHLFRGLEHYAPIDAAMLERYRVFARMGAFGVDLRSRRGAADFVRNGSEILSRPERALWITAQGRFADVRARPLGLLPGVGRLAELGARTYLPLALEHVFWTERGGESLVAFGPPLDAAELRLLPRNERMARLEAALATTMDRLAEDAIARDPARFTSVVEGRPGVGGVYDLWRRGRAALRGERFDPAHLRRAA